MALPDSLLTDSQSLRDKTLKVGLVARACAIFNVERIYLYRDSSGNHRKDSQIIKNLLVYAETPQYLRRRLFTHQKELRYAGLLPPLRTPHHKLASSNIDVGEYREGAKVKMDGRLYVDVGLPNLIPFEGNEEGSQRVTVSFTSTDPSVRCRPADRKDVNQYWGYDVKTVASLKELVGKRDVFLTILTSRKGTPLSEVWEELIHKLKGKILVIFGGPRKGILEILREEGLDPTSLSAFIVNFLPGQGVATVRTEEALFVTLGILNMAKQLANL